MMETVDANRAINCAFAVVGVRSMNGVPRLMAILLYGPGLRLMECSRLRIKDIDFSLNEVVVRSGKGDKDRAALCCRALFVFLESAFAREKSQHDQDLKSGWGPVSLPNALGRKYPHADREWGLAVGFPGQNPLQ